MQKFNDVYSPEQNLSFDEATCPWRGRLRFRIYNPLKPTKFGMKLYQVCEASSGYYLGFDIYTSDTSCTEYTELVRTDPDTTVTTKIGSTSTMWSDRFGTPYLYGQLLYVSWVIL